MIRQYPYRIIIVLLALFSSCIDPIDLDLDEGDSRLVVFGWITNEVKPYEIKITRSNGYSDLSGFPKVTGAEVYVVDDKGSRFDFIENASSGKYYSNPLEFVGKTDTSYQLNIIIGEETYVSTLQEMPPVGIAEDAFVNFIADPEEFEIDSEDENYFISAFVDDEESRENFYRWKVYVNGQLRNLPEELVLFDDRFTNGNKFKHDAGNVLFRENDQVYFEQMSMSKSAFQYYKDLKEQTNTSTLSPRIQPGVVVGNMTNLNNSDELVLGFFGASEIIKVELAE